MWKDICGSQLYTLLVSFCSKHNIFSKIINVQNKFAKAKPELKMSINIGLL